MGFSLTEHRTELSVNPGEKVEAISTGSLMFDYVTGIGGLPRGRMIEIFGAESSGKSTFMFQAGAQVQLAGGVVLFLDYENAFMERYAQACGLDTSPSKLLVEQPLDLDSGFEKAMEITKAVTAERVPLLVIFDSVAAMPLEGESVDNNTAAMQRAKKIYGHLRLAVHPVNQAGAIWAFINHEQTNIFTGAPWEIQRDKIQKGATSTPGGKAIKFYSSQRFRLEYAGALKGDMVDVVTGEVVEGIIAKKMRVIAHKNKVGHPERKAEVLIRFGEGVDNNFSILNAGLKRDLITKSGNTLSFPDGSSVVGAQKALDHLRSSPALAAQLDAQIRELMEAEWEKQQADLISQARAVHDDSDFKE